METQENKIENKIEWEMFLDESYYDMWSVRPVGDKDFNSPRLFRFDNRNDANNFKVLVEIASCAKSSVSNTLRIALREKIDKLLDCINHLSEIRSKN